MVIYVDGCSYTAGYGLDPQYSLSALLSQHFGNTTIIDKSYVGKSNYSMALDLYNQTADLYIIGWTYHARIEFDFDKCVVQSAPSRSSIRMDHNEFFEKEYEILTDKFFKYNSRYDKISDYFIDSSAALTRANGARTCYFSWEKRACNEQLLYPKFKSKYRQQDTPDWKNTGHLTQQGMEILANMVLAHI